MRPKAATVTSPMPQVTSSLATLNITNSGDVTYLAVPVRIATPTMHHEPLLPLLSESPTPSQVIDLPPPLLAASLEAGTQTSLASSLESVRLLQCDNLLDAIDVVDSVDDNDEAVRDREIITQETKVFLFPSTNSITYMSLL